MIIFKDIISDAELLSDSFPIKEIDGVFLEADCAMIELGAVNVDTGANASAEEASEDVDDTVQKVNNILHSFSYQPTTFDKKSYKAYISKYLKDVKKKLTEKGASDEEIADFQKKAQAGVMKILSNFNDYEFYMNGDDPEAMIALLNYREDGVTPYITLFKHGLTEMKV